MVAGSFKQSSIVVSKCLVTCCRAPVEQQLFAVAGDASVLDAPLHVTQVKVAVLVHLQRADNDVLSWRWHKGELLYIRVFSALEGR